MTAADCVLDAKALLGEGAHWDVREQRLYWVDVKRQSIHKFDPVTRTSESWLTPEMVSAVVVRERGDLVVTLKSGFHFYNLATREATPVALPHEPLNNRFNDGKTDRQGRFWAGTMDEGEKLPTAGLFRLDQDLECKKLVDGIIISNALCWSPDGRIMYFGDSVQGTVWAWDFDRDTGAVTHRRVFAEIPREEGVPDGATVDAEGFVWIAIWDGWQVRRYDPKGRTNMLVRLPVQRPTCPSFGGPNLDVVYVTSASIGLSERELQEQPLAGGLFAFDAGVRGVPEMRFNG